MTRILVYTGKGGVGKTSCAAATALACAERGYRTMVLSTDIAHSLGDVYGVELGPEPREIAPNLWGQESEVFHNVARYWGKIQEYASSVLRWRGLDDVIAEEITVLPGMDEVGSLLWIADHHDSEQYDVIVVDAAPTGETLRLLSLPEAARWWMEKVEPIGRRVSRAHRAAGPAGRGHSHAGRRGLRCRRGAVRCDSSTCTTCWPMRRRPRSGWCSPSSQVVIKEAQRAFTYFHLYDYPTDLVIANRILPDAVGAYFRGWYDAQRANAPIVEQTFAPIPVFTAPYFEREVVGVERLRELAEAVYHGADPTEHFYRGRPYSVVRDGDVFVLSLELPFTTKEQISLSRHADELVVDVGTWRRNLVLPRALVRAEALGAQFEDHVLKIRFKAPPRPATDSSSRR